MFAKIIPKYVLLLLLDSDILWPPPKIIEKFLHLSSREDYSFFLPGFVLIAFAKTHSSKSVQIYLKGFCHYNSLFSYILSSRLRKV